MAKKYQRPDDKSTACINIEENGELIYQVFFKSYGYPEGRFGMVRFIDRCINSRENTMTDRASWITAKLMFGRFKYISDENLMVFPIREKLTDINADFYYTIDLSFNLKIEYRLGEHKVPIYEGDVKLAKDKFEDNKQDMKFYYNKMLDFLEKQDNEEKINIRYIEPC